MDKEREQLLMMNTCSLKQPTERDEMDAKSLATILHIKDLIEQRTAEKKKFGTASYKCVFGWLLLLPLLTMPIHA